MNDVPIKDYKEEAKDFTLEDDGCCTFVIEYIEDIKYILKRFKEINLTLFLKKFTFGFKEIIIVGHLYRSYGRKPNLD